MSLKSKKELNALNARKQKVITTGKGHPARSEGHSGDIVIRRIPKKGLHLFVKYAQKWYSIPLEEKTDSKYDRDRLVAKPRLPKESPYNHEIAALGDDIVVKLDANNTHTLGKSSTKIVRDVVDGNPTWQMGSSDDECFKILAVYNTEAKGLDYVQFVSATVGGDADAGAMYWLVGGVQQMSLGDDLLDVNGCIDLTSTTADQLKVNYDANNYLKTDISSAGVCTITTVGGTPADADLILDVGGDIELNADGGAITFKDDSTTLAALNSSGDFAPLGDMTLNDDKKLILGADTNTYIYSDADDVLRIYVGGNQMMGFFEDDPDGNIIVMGGSVGFVRGTTGHSDNDIIAGGGAHDTDVDFRNTNKQFLELDGNVNDLNFIFPGTMSGNFVLLLKQDSTGERLVTNYKVWEGATGGVGNPADGSATLLWAGGANPTLTTTGNKTDIISIFWSSTTPEQAYATITHNF